MAIWYEAWTLPWDAAGFKRKFFYLPTVEGSGRGTISFLTTQGEGIVDVPLDHLTAAGRDLTEIVSDTTASLIRVFDSLPDGTVTIIDEWVCERPARRHEDGRVATISGPPLKTKAFDGSIVRPFDYPANPTLTPDHIWGGDNVLSDPGFETPAVKNEQYELVRDGATGGNFTVTVDGQTTPSMAWNIGPVGLENNIEALSTVTDVLVTATSDGWTVEFHNPSEPGSFDWTPAFTGGGGDEEIKTTVEGLIEPSGTWTTSQHADASVNPHIHGTYATDGFRLTDPDSGFEPVHSGTYAARINGLSQFAGIQQIVQVEPGMTYQLSIWFWSSDASEEFRLVARDIYDNLITEDSFTNVTNATPSTWTEVTLELVVPEGIDTIIFRFAQTVDHNPDPFYVDDAAMNEGQPPTTWGDIVDILMGTRVDLFFWIDWAGVDVTNDSGSVVWPGEETVTVQFGETFGQLWDLGVDLGYEWNLIPKDTPVGGWDPLDETHELVWYVKAGMDADPSTAINPGPSVTGGESFNRIPAYTRVYVEGSEGVYVEDEDATALANFGPMEKYEFNTHLNSEATSQARAAELLSYESANRNAVRFELIATLGNPRPGVHFKPGDTIPMQLPPGLQKVEKRVQDFSYVNTYPAQYIVTGSRVLEGEAAAYNLLWRIWRRLNKPQKPRRSGGILPGGGGGMAHILIVSTSEPSNIQKKGDYVVPHTNSGASLQAIFDTVNDKWTIWMAGDFELDQNVTAPAGCRIRGLGYPAPVET